MGLPFPIPSIKGHPHHLLTFLSDSLYYVGVMYPLNGGTTSLSTPGRCFRWAAYLAGGGLMGGVTAYLLTFSPLYFLPSYMLLFSILSVLFSLVPLIKGLNLLLRR